VDSRPGDSASPVQVQPEAGGAYSVDAPGRHGRPAAPQDLRLKPGKRPAPTVGEVLAGPA
jgi:hypothetical protein